MKKVLLVIFCVLLMIPYNVKAQQFEGNEDYYNDLCSKDNGENKEVCQEYREYLKQKNQNFREKLNSLNNEIKNLEANIQEAIANSKSYQSEINILQKEVDALNEKIAKLQTSITSLTENINKTQTEVNNLKSKILKRMKQFQVKMRFNPFLEFIMGARSFEDLIIRSRGIRVIMEHDSRSNEELKKLIIKLNTDKRKLESQKNDLDKSKKAITDKQEDLIIKRAYFDALKVELLKKQEDLRSSSAQIASNLESIKSSISKVGGIATANGWTSPVQGDWWNASGTWYYDTGGRHLGLDMATSYGTTVVAPGNGVVVQTYDGCDTVGYLGSSCGVLQGLGNQIRLVVTVDGDLYGVTIGHLESGSVIATGTQVSAGDYIARVGSSGSSTGPHAHVEVVYLGSESYWDDGTGAPIDVYIEKWDGHLSFGAGRYSSDFLSYACENNYQAPCRLRPENIFN